MAKFEEKFFVVNLKHINQMPPVLRCSAYEAIDYIERRTPHNEYYACNRDEPYADEVLQVILEGEKIKSFILDESDIGDF